MLGEDNKEIGRVLERLVAESQAKVVFLVSQNGKLIAARGDTDDLDTTNLASLTAGNIASAGGLSKLLSEKEFSILFHEGESDNLHISIVARRVILVVIFDKHSNLEVVRFRVEEANAKLTEIFDGLDQDRDNKGPGPGGRNSGGTGGQSGETMLTVHDIIPSKKSIN